MVQEASGNLKQFWESLRHLWTPLKLFRKLSVTFRGLWHIQNGPRSLW